MATCQDRRKGAANDPDEKPKPISGRMSVSEPKQDGHCKCDSDREIAPEEQDRAIAEMAMRLGAIDHLGDDGKTFSLRNFPIFHNKKGKLKLDILILVANII